MPYQRTMGGDNPGLFVFVLDQSGSMGDPWPKGPQQRKADALADVINNTLAEICDRCVRGEGQVSDRCHMAIVGYEGSSFHNAWGATLNGKDVVLVSEVSANPEEVRTMRVQVPDGRGGLVETDEQVPVWVRPRVGGGTPMKMALGRAQTLVNDWVSQHPAAFPPVVVHVTDGESTDGDPSAEAASIRNIQTSDGNVLLVNIHIPSTAPNSVSFPAGVGDLPGGDQYARMLFEMSSEIPGELLPLAQKAGLNARQGSKLMILNADATDVIRLIQFATVGTLNR